MIVLLVSVSVVLLTVFVFHKRRPVLTIVPMSWSPLQILWFPDLREKQAPVPDYAAWAVHSDQQKTSALSEISSDFSCFSDSEADIIRQEPDYFSLAAPCWEENDSEYTAVRCTRELVSPNCVLDACNADIFVSQSPERAILPV